MDLGSRHELGLSGFTKLEGEKVSIVRLTDTAWLEYQAERVRGILLQNLGREGVEQSKLKKLIADYGLDYSSADLVLIRDALVADGLIEIENG